MNKLTLILTRNQVDKNNYPLESVPNSAVLYLYNLGKADDETAGGTFPAADIMVNASTGVREVNSVKGNISVNAAYTNILQYLNSKYPYLKVTALNEYLSFSDHVVEAILLLNNYGDGIGITAAQAALKTGIIDNIFLNNLDIISLDDLAYFVNLSGIGLKFATGCTNLQSVVIPDGILNISEGNWSNFGAFRDCTNLSSVTLNEGLLNIDNRSFMGCTSLQEITIPSTVTKIGKTSGAVFRGCTELAHVYGGTNVEFLAAESFYGCTGLRDIAFSSNLTTIGNSAFEGCSALGSMNISSVLQLGDRAFFGCSLMTSVTLNPSLTAIPSAEFLNCTSLSSIDLSNITRIEANAFGGCTSLTSVDLSSCTKVAGGAFGDCSNLGVGEEMDLYLPDNTDLPGFARTKYSKLVIRIPNNTMAVYDIRWPQWHNMYNLTYLDLSDIKFASNTLFGRTYGDTQLRTIILSKDYAQLVDVTTEGLTNLQHLILLRESPMVVTTPDQFNIARNGINATIYVPNETIRLQYLAASDWSQVQNASTRIKTLADLPVGVWTTGLYKSYEPYLSNSSDPAYANLPY